jgi:polyhydroxyalkanoate synthase subunit PhaC
MTSSHTPTQSSWHSVLDDFAGITENLTVGSDSTDMLRELLIASGMTLKNPAGIIAANTRLIWGSAGAFRAAVGRAIGRDNAGPIAMPAGDKRFSDAAYQENPAYFVLAQQYLLFSQYVAELLDTAGVSGTREAKARFAAKFLVDALAPTNTLAGNPAAIRKAFDTGGKSIVKGLRNLAHDLLHNGGWPSQNPPNPKGQALGERQSSRRSA